MSEEAKRTREMEKKEEAKQKKQNKERKKREQKDAERKAKEIKVGLEAVSRVLDRLKGVDDMNMRCYLLLDKLMLVSELGLTLLPTDASDDIKIELRDMIGRWQLEFKNIMDWLIAEKKIPLETANPIPENNLSERRRGL